jgi:hypothetical protein
MLRIIALLFCALGWAGPVQANTITFTFDGSLPFYGPAYVYPADAVVDFPDQFARPYQVVLNDEVGLLRQWKYDTRLGDVFEVQFRAFSGTLPDYLISATSGMRDASFHDVFLRFNRAMTLLDYRLSSPHFSDDWDLIVPGQSTLLLGVPVEQGFGLGIYRGPLEARVEIAPIPVPGMGVAFGCGLGLVALRRRVRGPSARSSR